MSNWQPLCLKKDFSTSTPVCASCKKTNRTKSFCRERHKHRQLPWCTVYVILSAVDATDPSTVVAAPSQLNASETENEGKATTVAPPPPSLSPTSSSDRKKDDTTTASASMPAPPNTAAESNVSSKQKVGEEADEDPQNITDDIHKIEASRTFLAQVSCHYNTIHWLEQTEGESVPATNESEVKALNQAIRTPAMHQEVHHQTILPPHQHYYPMINPQYFQQQQQQHYASWHAQYGQPVMMPPPPMMPMPMGAPHPGSHPPPTGPPPPVESPTKVENNVSRNENDHNEAGTDINATESALGPPGGEAPAGDDNKTTELETPTSVSFSFASGISKFLFFNRFFSCIHYLDNFSYLSKSATALINVTQPDAQAQWHAQMMYHHQMYHQQFFAHQQYMAQQAHHAHIMNQQSPPPPGEHEQQHQHAPLPPTGGEGDVEPIHDITIEQKQEGDAELDVSEAGPEQKRAKIGDIDPTSVQRQEANV